MIEEMGRVVEVLDDAAWVETEPKSTCGSCSANKGCGVAVFSKLVRIRRARIKVENTLAAKVGDEVVIGVAESAMVQGSLAVYAVPLLSMLGFALLGEAINTRLEITGTESMNILFGLGGLAGGFAWLRRYAMRISKDARYRPIILRHASSVVLHPTTTARSI